MKCDKCGQPVDDGWCLSCAVETSKAPVEVKVEITESCANALKRVFESAPKGDDDQVARIKAWFKGKGGLALKWGDDSSRVCDLLCGWIDVHVEAIERDLGLNWVWTVISDEDPDKESEGAQENEWVILLPYTHRYVEIFPTQEHTEPEFTAVWDDGLPLTREIESKISNAQEFGKVVRQGGAWTPQSVSKALSDWVWNRTGHTVDFEFDPSMISAMFKKAMEALPEALKEPTVPLGDLLDDIEDNPGSEEDPE